MNVNVDLIGSSGQIQGDVAGLLAQGQFNVGEFRPFIGKDKKVYVSVFKGGDPAKLSNYQNVPKIGVNATLRRDEWKHLDEAIIKVSRYRLGGIDDLIANGLTYNLGNGMGVTVLEWHDVSDPMEADVTMDAITRSKGDRPKYQHNYLPIPIIHVDFEINARALAASRNMGNPLDTTSVESGTRRIREKLENMLFTDTTYAFGETDTRGRNSIYSYVNHPDRNQVTLGTNWNASGKSAADLLTDVINMKQASIDALHYGPWMLYIPTAYETVLDQDYDTTTPGTTIRERILKIGDIKGIKIVDTLKANNVLLVQMTNDVVRLVRGMGITNVQWDTEGKFLTRYKILTIQVPQIRSDQNGASGIVHLAS